MLLLSIGMPRAGSGWYYQLQHDLMLVNGGKEARSIRHRYHLERILTEVNCNIGALTPWRLIPVLLPSLLGSSYVIKAHAAPTPIAKWMIHKGWLKATYIYRDPRDAMLSAYENGQRALQNGRKNAFSQLTSFEKSLSFMEDYVRIANAWLACTNILHTRYEDLLTQYDEETKRLLHFLQIFPTAQALQIIKRYQPQEAQHATQAGLHFRKGKMRRFLQAYNPEQQAQCWQKFAPFLQQQGYSEREDELENE